MPRRCDGTTAESERAAGQRRRMIRGLLTRVILAAAMLCVPLIGRLAAQDQPEVLTVDQAVKIALANHRT